MKSDIEIQVDVKNPGEFFACCGLLELADRLSSGAEGWFAEDKFFITFLDASGGVTIHEALWSVVNTGAVGEPDDKVSPLTLGEPLDMRLSWWLRPEGGSNRVLKTWAANASSLQMFSKWEIPVKEILQEEDPDPTSLFRRQTSLQGPYGFDSKFGWDALSVGFSLNEHIRYKKSQVRPVVEMLGAIGLQRFTPDIDQSKGIVRYATWRTPLPPSVACLAALGKLPYATLLKMESKTTRRGSFKGLATARMQTGDLDD
ncbi:MAG: hypothetical protein OXD31_13115 [Chloroflexi bacterium]|nr:hypothetical protein [Chloroflexota bacterium]